MFRHKQVVVFLFFAAFALWWTVGDVFRPLTQRGHLLVFEAEINSTRAGETQVFWNAGRGYRGRYSSTQELTRPHEWQRLVLPLTGRSIDGLRLDPLDGQSTIYLRNMRVRTLGGRTVREFGIGDIGEREFIESIEAVGDGKTIRITVGEQRDPQFVFKTDYPIRVGIPIPLRYAWLFFHLALVGSALFLIWRSSRKWAWSGPGTLAGFLAGLWVAGFASYAVYGQRWLPLPLGQPIFQLAIFALAFPCLRSCLNRLGHSPGVIATRLRQIQPPCPAKLLLILGGGFGLVFVFLTPPYQSPDEYNWFYRAFHISEGNLLPRIHERVSLEGEDFLDAGGMFPEDLWTLLHASGGTGIVFRPHIKADLENLVKVRSELNRPEPREFRHLRDTLHSLPPYLPQAAGIWIVRAFNGNLLDQFYGGRLGNLAACLGLGLLILRTYPPLGWIFLALFCNPLSLFLIASNSHDPLVNLLCFLALALVMRVREKEGTIRPYEVAALLLIFLLILISKFNYIVLLPLLFLIPARRFRHWQHRASVLGAIAGATFIGLLLLFYGLSHYPPGDWGQPDIDRGERLKHVLTHPGETFSMYVNTIGKFGPDYTRQIGGVLGWLDTDIGSPARWLWATAAILATAMIAFASRRLPLRWADRAWVLLTAFAGFVSILMIFLLIWTPTGMAYIVGVQGRYFLVLLPLLLLGISPARSWDNRWEGLLGRCIILLIFCSLCLAVYWSYYRYWTPLPVVEV